jgi:ABC-2 type transport system ATP-binding protein
VIVASDLVIETRELTKAYGKKQALGGLTLEVPRGSICGLLGRNGAGKTTSLKILIGLTRPTSGSGTIFDLQIGDPAASVRIRQRTGFVTEDKLFPPSFTVGELLRFTRAFYPSWRTDLEERYLRAFELSARMAAGALSKGARCGLALLLAIARDPELLLLDEPTEGLDPAAKEQALQAIVALAADHGTTVLFSSHQISEVELIADQICIIDSGRAVLNASLDELKTSYRRVQIVFEGEVPQERFPGARRDGRMLSLLVTKNLDEVVERARCMQVKSVEILPVSLSEIFLETAKGGLR